jgi:hypothetical protein
MPAKKGDGSEFGLSEDERAETLQFARRRRDRPRAAKAQVTSKPGKPLGIDFKTTLDLTRFENIPQQDSNGGLAVKLLRTFTMQLEALQRYRGKGHQKVVVEHVHVHAGAQAIVGSVAPRKGDRRQSGERGIEPREVTHEPTTPLRSPDPCREAVPIAGSSRKTAL